MDLLSPLLLEKLVLLFLANRGKKGRLLSCVCFILSCLRRYRHGALRGFLRSYQNCTGTQHDADGALGVLSFAVAAGAALGQQRTMAGLAGLYAVSVNNTFILFVFFEKRVCLSNPFVTNLLQIMRISAIINL